VEAAGGQQIGELVGGAFPAGRAAQHGQVDQLHQVRRVIGRHHDQ
jgi:hypothetical protein